ncbi:MAG: hypothetical protein M0036_05285 [Desulfobacteraceae bacterium]|nr:hypothetical protein [Desulfobacteraceae bacterium]
MNSKMKLRWMVVAGIWGLALVMTLWNTLRIDDVARARDKSEQIRKEIAFQHQNAQTLSRLLKFHDALYLRVESVDLGIVSVRGRVQALAAAFDLQGFSMLPEAGQITEELVPFHLSMQGSMANVAGFLTALQKFSYLQVRQASVKTAREAGAIELEFDLSLHYQTTSPPDETEAVSMGTLDPLMTGKGRL